MQTIRRSESKPAKRVLRLARIVLRACAGEGSESNPAVRAKPLRGNSKSKIPNSKQIGKFFVPGKVNKAK
jgi:hypothetical protein